MCGICGIVNYSDQRVEPDVLAAMARTMKHRGPDDEGFHIGKNIGLGHRRLSIIDLKTGRQPIHNENKSLWIVYNGELYNSPWLREELRGLGHDFYTRSDTEVIVHAYEQFGKDCLHRFNGIFAFALWDDHKKRLFLARDRVGVKPLYYAQSNDRLIFASEIKAILAHPEVDRTIDLTALNHYLTFEYVPSPRTIFQSIKKLGPGQHLTFERSGLHIESYWDISLSKSENAPIRGQGSYVTDLYQLLREVVEMELLADVPTGVLLSGGIDSSAVAAMMTLLNPGTVKSFSITFDDPSFDESMYARTVAKHLGTDHHEMRLSPETMLDVLPKVVETMDEPLGDSSIIPTYLLAKFTASHVKVALGGDGGDELFAGYSTLQAHRLAVHYERLVPKFISHGAVAWLVQKLPVSFDNISLDYKAKRFVAGQDEPPAIRHHIWLGSFTEGQKRCLLKREAWVLNNTAEDVALYHFDNCDSRDLINRILYCDMKLYLDGDILAKVDRAGMANSLEVRVPLLNEKLLNFTESLPLDFKLRGLRTKFILRQAMKKLLPASILNRGKKGFNMPVAKWLTGPLKPLATDMLSADRLKRQGLFEPDYVEGLMADHLAGIQDNRKLLWTLLVFQLWQERWG